VIANWRVRDPPVQPRVDLTDAIEDLEEPGNIHKVPMREGGIWTQAPRYTFESMNFDVTN
jgi:hypothetical protein